MQEDDEQRIRLDKWLWAARFFKTRTLAVEAINGGKVQIEGANAKPAREVRLEMKLTVRNQQGLRTVIVRRLLDVRRPAAEAITLYEETIESLERRHRETELRGLAPQRDTGSGRPTKRDRRRLQKLSD